jgi:hypothetical protein
VGAIASWTRQYLAIPPTRLPVCAAASDGKVFIGCIWGGSAGSQFGEESYGYVLTGGDLLPVQPELASPRRVIGIAGAVAWQGLWWAVVWEALSPVGSEVALWTLEPGDLTWRRQATIGAAPTSQAPDRALMWAGRDALEVYWTARPTVADRCWGYGQWRAIWLPGRPVPHVGRAWLSTARWHSSEWTVRYASDWHTLLCRGQPVLQVPAGPCATPVAEGASPREQVGAFGEWVGIATAARMVWVRTLLPYVGLAWGTTTLALEEIQRSVCAGIIDMRRFARIDAVGERLTWQYVDYWPTAWATDGRQIWVIGLDAQGRVVCEWTPCELRVGKVLFEGASGRGAATPRVGQVQLQYVRRPWRPRLRLGRVRFESADGAGHSPRIGRVLFLGRDGSAGLSPRVGRALLAGQGTGRGPEEQVRLGRVSFEAANGGGSGPRVGRLSFMAADGSGAVSPRVGRVLFLAADRWEDGTARIVVGRATFEGQDIPEPPTDDDLVLATQAVEGDGDCYALLATAVGLTGSQEAACRLLARADTEDAPADNWASYQEGRLGARLYFDRPGRKVRIALIGRAGMPPPLVAVQLARQEEV